MNKHDVIRHLLALGRVRYVPPEVQVEREMSDYRLAMND